MWWYEEWGGRLEADYMVIVEPSWMGFVPSLKRPQRTLLSLPPGHSENTARCEPGWGPSGDTESWSQISQLPDCEKQISVAYNFSCLCYFVKAKREYSLVKRWGSRRERLRKVSKRFKTDRKMVNVERQRRSNASPIGVAKEKKLNNGTR